MRGLAIYGLAGLLMACWGPLAAQASPPAQRAAVSAGTPEPTDLESVQRARAQLQADLADRERACRRGFWVHSCLQNVRETVRREAADLDQKERALQTALRQQRAERAQERVRDKVEGLERRQATKAPPLSDLELEQRLEKAHEERAEQAQERLLRQQQKQSQADQRNQGRERSAQSRQERAERATAADGQRPPSPSAQPPSQAAR